MADTHSKEIRSYNMSRIRSKDTKPELLVRKFLHSRGFRYKIHVKDLPGKPDVVLPKYRTVIFVHGCFWHGHESCKYHVVPKSNLDYWIPKLNRNISKDKKNEAHIVSLGWRIVKIWECELKGEKLKQTLKEIENFLVSQLS